MLEMTCQLMFLGSPLLLAAVAQGLCIKYDWMSWLKRPLDFGLTYKGKRIFGDHKTWRGLAINLVFCSLGAGIQGWLQKENYVSPWLFLLDYTRSGYLIGLFVGLGMTLGELPNSFIKRRLEISPGKRTRGLIGIALFFFDQVDLTIGIWIFLLFLMRPSPLLILWSFPLTIVLHVLVSGVGYLLRMRKTLF
ncbi:MAG: CDP-archaeol synthase [Pseudomonadota bacterium]